MFAIQKSAIFMRQWKHYAQDYKKQAGMAVAGRFVKAVEEALHFIIQNPYACSRYNPGKGNEDLQVYKFKKLNVRGFPHVILFRFHEAVIFVEVLYAHKMDIPTRLTRDKKRST